MLPENTSRLAFRQLTLNDVDNLQTIFSDPIAMEYYPATKSMEETKAWINWCIESYSKHGHGLWAVSLKESGIFIGQCGIIHHTFRGTPDKEIVYLFQRQHWHKGYATEAAMACKEHAFKTMHFAKVVSFIDPANEPSSNVAKRIGMQLEGISRPEQNRWKKILHVYSATNG